MVLNYLDANIGDIIYIRKYDTVKAVKYTKSSCGTLGIQTHRGIIAGEGDKEQVLQWGKFYRSIEDCINGINPIAVLKKDVREIAEENNFGELKVEAGKLYIFRFTWNSFHPKAGWYDALGFVWWLDADGFHVKNNAWKTWSSYEECIAANHVKVVTF